VMSYGSNLPTFRRMDLSTSSAQYKPPRKDGTRKRYGKTKKCGRALTEAGSR
jgi:hypothetical protein